MNRPMSSSRNVSVSLAWLPIESDQVPASPDDDQALDDEAVGRLDEQHVLHPALVEERADRAEDLLEVLARAALVDPHRAPLRPASLAQEPVVRSSSPRSLARRSLARKTRMAASVTSAPVTSKARTISAASGAAVPVSCSNSDARRRRSTRPGREQRSADALDPPAQRRERPIAWTGAGRTPSGNTAPLTRNSAPATRLGVGPRLLAGLQADRGHEDADRDDRRRARGPSRPRAAASRCAPRSNGTPRRSTPTASVMSAPDRPDREPRDAAAEQHDQEVARADVDVLEHPVALAIVEHGPGEAGDAGQHERPERACRRPRTPDRSGRRCRRR